MIIADISLGVGIVALGVATYMILTRPKIDADVVYGHKDGMALTYDVLRPAKQNGAGILWIQSGGWYSNWQDAKNFVGAGKQFFDKGFTLFIVRHGSAPKYAVPDAVADVAAVEAWLWAAGAAT